MFSWLHDRRDGLWNHPKVFATNQHIRSRFDYWEFYQCLISPEGFMSVVEIMDIGLIQSVLKIRIEFFERPGLVHGNSWTVSRAIF